KIPVHHAHPVSPLGIPIRPKAGGIGKHGGEAVRLSPGPVVHDAGVELCPLLEHIHIFVEKLHHPALTRFQGGMVLGGCTGSMGIFSCKPASKNSRSANWGLASTRGAVKLGFW